MFIVETLEGFDRVPRGDGWGVLPGRVPAGPAAVEQGSEAGRPRAGDL
jgi:hypothetical protein